MVELGGAASAVSAQLCSALLAPTWPQPTLANLHPACLLQLLGKGEIAPGLHFTELQQRRQNLANLMPPGSLAIIPAASLAYVAGVIPYPYRQDADFMYLTGIQQQAVALIRTGGEQGLGALRCWQLWRQAVRLLHCSWGPVASRPAAAA